MQRKKNNSIYNPLIAANELGKIQFNADVIIVDASSGPQAKSNYEQKHLAGALFIDLTTDLAEIEDDVSVGGRHPLPSLASFEQTLSRLGITPQSHVVIYDDKYGSIASARFWWMLKAIGHEKVQVLNGGLQAAENAGIGLNDQPVTIYPNYYGKISKWNLPLTAIDEVVQEANDPTKIIIDVREAGRYRGEFEPIDLIAGHIPGAINIPYSENLDENGLFLSPEKLHEKYQQIFEKHKASDITVHCGSGVTACHTLLALAHTGFDLPKLYIGSWSEWSRSGRGIATGE